MDNYVRHNINANAEIMRYVLKYKGFRWIAAKVVMEWAKDVASGWWMEQEDMDRLNRILNRWHLHDVYRNSYFIQKGKSSEQSN